MDDRPRMIRPRLCAVDVAGFDDLLDGGLVGDSSTLLGGEPGVGKSTLIAQIARSFAGQGLSLLYVSSEESETQVLERLDRLGGARGVGVASTRDVRAVVDWITSSDYQVVFIDSLQSLSLEGVDSGSSSPQALRTIAELLSSAGKAAGVALVMTSQINKEGALLGPKAIEHVVDTVLYLEGERDLEVRTCRVAKHRFGRAPRSMGFVMESDGLRAISDLGRSELLMRPHVPGRVVVPVIEGGRARLVEIQALVASSSITGQRVSCIGLEGARVGMILAILERYGRLGLGGGSHLYLQVDGGVEVRDPGADLSIALAIASAIRGEPLVSSEVFVGELSLLGEIRPPRYLISRFEYAATFGMSFFSMLDPGRTGSWPSLAELVGAVGLGAVQVRAVG